MGSYAAVILSIALGLLGSSCIESARASPPIPLIDAVHGGLAAVGPAFVDSFTVTCATTATLIQSPAGAMVSYGCQTPASAEATGTVLVAIGDSAIADPAIGTRNSPVYSGDTVREFGGNARQEYCRADTGTVVIYCRGLVSVTSAP